jgi:hypothetical protein
METLLSGYYTEDVSERTPLDAPTLSGVIVIVTAVAALAALLLSAIGITTRTILVQEIPPRAGFERRASRAG